jgi:L-asparaginase II
LDAKLVEITRGPLIEGTHTGSVAVVSTDGRLVAYAGDVSAPRFFRSSAKPFQAIPVVASGAADAFAFTTQEIAICSASHDAAEYHQEVVSSVLSKIGRNEDDLRCGFTPPLDEEEKARITLGLVEPTQIKCECSGEHAGMLAACTHSGWPIDNYNAEAHPLQQLIRTIVAAACGVAPDELTIASDGCSIPTFGASIQAFARAYAVLADPEGADWDAPTEWRTALIRLREAITTHPELITGEDGHDTVIMQLTEGRVLAKLGAEGLICLSIPGHGLGIAISDAAGASRSLGPAAVGVLEQLGVESEETIASLKEALCPPVQSFKGAEVGETRPAVVLNGLDAAADPRSDEASTSTPSIH